MSKSRIMRVLVILAIFLGTISNLASSAQEFILEAAVNDEIFIINGEVFKAQTYCFGWDEGDRVIFLDGSPYGACVSAVLYNLDKRKKCRVWCE